MSSVSPNSETSEAPLRFRRGTPGGRRHERRADGGGDRSAIHRSRDGSHEFARLPQPRAGAVSIARSGISSGRREVDAGRAGGASEHCLSFAGLAAGPGRRRAGRVSGWDVR
jgi:hypothetical protein